MVDTDVRLGLSGSDLMIRDRQFKKDIVHLDESNLTPDMSEDFKAIVDGGFSDEIITAKRFRGQDFLIVKKERIVELLTFVRDTCQYNLVSDILGIDLLGFDKEPRFEVVYSLYSIPNNRRIVIKAQVDEDEPIIDTVCSVWPAADWAEREIYDLFGIEFRRHNDMRRILMPDDWIGHPLRKDYPLGGEEVEFSHNVRGQQQTAPI